MKLIRKIINFLRRYNKKQKQMSFDDICLLLVKKKNPIIFDVGANAGQSIIRLKNYFLIQLFILLNRLKKNVIAYY